MINTVSDISMVNLHLNVDTENLNTDIRTWNHIYTPWKWPKTINAHWEEQEVGQQMIC